MSLSNSDFATIVNTVRETQAQLIPESTKFNHEAEKKIKKPKKVYTKAERERREAKKASYLEYKKTMDELSAKYRDRAKERREGKDETEQKDQNLINDLQAITKNSIGKDKKFLTTEDSKFLGGDIEHTHLVKGLDYALLRKKRQEMAEEEKQKELEMEKLVSKHRETTLNIQKRVLYNSNFGKRICEQALENESLETKSLENELKKYPKVNKLFLPGRMAFIFDTSKKGPTLPTSIIRSEIEVSTADREHANAVEKAEKEGESTNDIVVNKLIQILYGYIRTGDNKNVKKHRKIFEDGKKLRQEKDSQQTADQQDEIQPEREEKQERRRDRDDKRDDRDRHWDRDRRDKDSDRHRERRDRDRDRRDRDRDRRDRDRDRDHDRRGRDRDDDRSRSRKEERAVKRESERKSRFEQPKTEQVEFAGSAALDSDGSDIFADVGEYVCDVSKPTKKKKTVGFRQPGAEEESETVSKKSDKAHFDTTEIEDSLPVAPKKLKLTTSEDIINQAKKMASDKKLGITNSDDEEQMTTKRKQAKLPQGSLAFGMAGASYGDEYDDDDRMDDELYLAERNKKEKSGRMNEKSFVNQQWNKVSAIIDKNKKKKD